MGRRTRRWWPLSPLPSCPDESPGARTPPGATASHPHEARRASPVAVKIRLKRLGKIRAPYYRIVVADSRTKRDGRVIEEIGQYHPTEDPSVIKVDSQRAQYWLGGGAPPAQPGAPPLQLTGGRGRV